MYFSWSEGNQIYDGSALLFDKIPRRTKNEFTPEFNKPVSDVHYAILCPKIITKNVRIKFLIIEFFFTNIQNNWDEVIMLNVFIEF